MINRNTRKLQIIRQQACSVSRALWPTSTRRTVATGKVAQRRRQLIIHAMRLARIAHASRKTFPLTGIGASMLTGGFTGIAVASQRWYALGIPALIVTIIGLSVMRKQFKPLWHRQKSGQRSFPVIPHSSLRHTPETPMPSEPLVRVLETCDLSHTNVEHFLTLPEESSHNHHEPEYS